MKNLTLKHEEYLQLKEAFQGGFTHASVAKTGTIQKKVGSFDFTSSYPAVIVSEQFPMENAVYYPTLSEKELCALFEKNCCMFRVKITYLVPLNMIEHPLSSSKCRNIEDVAKDNGRVITAKYLETTLTEQDYYTLKEFYDWENIEFFDIYAYRKRYLPTPFIKEVLGFYADKTKLKGVVGEEVNYMLAKENNNSCYGMMVTDLVRENLEFDESNFMNCVSNYLKKDNETKEEYDKRIAEYQVSQIERYNNNPYRFTFYPWGVWVTAYARRNLFKGIRAVGYDYIYSDTDSLKILNTENHMDFINAYNEEILGKLKRACAYHGIDESLIRPKNKDGVEKPLGVWDFEGIYDEFKTLGAKRYMYRQGNKWVLTCAGVNKMLGCAYLLERTHEINRIRKHSHKRPISPLNLFSLELEFPPSHSGRTLVTYIDEEMSGTVVDYLGEPCEYHELSGIHMEAEEYSLNPVDQFIRHLFTIREESWD